MLLKAVPGLQFVVQRHIRPAQFQNQLSTIGHGSAAALARSIAKKGRSSEIQSEPMSYQQPRPSCEPSTGPVAPRSEYETYLHGQISLGSSDQAEVVPDEEAEAEALVNDLLKQYTTLFNP